MALLYLTQFLTQKRVHRQLRCNDQHVLEVPLTSLKYAANKSFQGTTMLYNALHVHIETATSLAVFKNMLKTNLFTKA